MILQELVPMGPLATPSNVHTRPPAPQLMEPAQEFPEIPPAEPQEMIVDGDDDKSPCFLEIGKERDPPPPALGFFLRTQVLSWLWGSLELPVT